MSTVAKAEYPPPNDVAVSVSTTDESAKVDYRVLTATLSRCVTEHTAWPYLGHELKGQHDIGIAFCDCEDVHIVVAHVHEAA